MCPFEFVTINGPTNFDLARTGPTNGASFVGKKCSIDQPCRIFERPCFTAPAPQRLRIFGVSSKLSEEAEGPKTLLVLRRVFVSRCVDRSSSRIFVASELGPLLAMTIGRELFGRPSTTESDHVLIVFSMQIVAPDEKRTEILRTLGSMLGPTRAAAGCTHAQLYADLDKRKTLLLIEEWNSREQFERNLDTAKLNTIVAAIELSSEAPVVRVDSVERAEGVDTLALHQTAAGNA
jgi:quinol monooxygenase YgiN